jgi:hypothetical protein
MYQVNNHQNLKACSQQQQRRIQVRVREAAKKVKNNE